MFTNARIKLTCWYLLIIMVVCFLFSGVIYRGVMTEIERGFHRAAMRYQASEFGLPIPFTPLPVLVEDLANARNHVINQLILANGFILLVSAIASYYLAGKTLAPIQTALEEQKRFVSDASHELHTPLTALKTSIEVALRDKKLTAAGAYQVLAGSLEEVDELATLTGNLLSLARFEKNSHGFHFGRVDLKDVIGQVARRLRPLANKKNISIILKTGNQVLTADESSLQKLLTIMVDNAIKYTPAGGEVNIETKVQRKDLVIKIQDTGVGIPKSDLPHIFDRFYRSDESRAKTGSSGFGLGLAIAKRIVDLHHGEIKVESKIGKGTTFIVKIPIAS